MIIVFKNESLKLEFKISVVDYQFPEIKTGGNSNWLNIKHECYYRDKNFTIIDSTITTFELDQISNWFYKISRNEIPEQVSLSFTEPDLSFILFSNIKGIVRYAIKLDLNPPPPFYIKEYKHYPDEDNEFDMFFESTFDELSFYYEQFKELCIKYPKR